MTESGSPVGRSRGLMRRRLAAGLTFVVGVTMLALTLRLEPGDDTFVLGALMMATTWAVGARACGALRWRGRGAARGGLVLGTVIGGGALLLCLAVGALVCGVPMLAAPAQELLAHRSTAAFPVVVTITAVNGVAEEMYFRGALYDALPARSAWLSSAALYALATVPSGVALLTAAAALLGVLTGLARRATGGLIAPLAAHLVWSLGMLLLLPSVLT